MEFAALAASEALAEELSDLHGKLAKSQVSLTELEVLKRSASEERQKQEELEFVLSALKDAVELDKERNNNRINGLIEEASQAKDQYLNESRRYRELEDATREIDYAARVRCRTSS